VPPKRSSLPGWLLVSLGLAVVVWRGSLALRWYHAWQGTRITDPSAAEAYEDSFWVEVVLAFVGAAFLAVGVWVARRRRRP
jgi:LPXTG-motif cell wall-anchored protein